MIPDDAGRAPAGDAVLLVIPAYRESRRLPVFLGPLLAALRESALPVRVRVVDDGSPPEELDATRAFCESLSGVYPALSPLLALPENLGKGGAVYAGWDSGKDCAWLGFCDADGSVGPDEVVRLIRILIGRGFPHDALVASRCAEGAGEVRRSPFRGALSRMFSAWVRRTTGLEVRDSQCGCKFVRRELYEKIRPGLVEARFAFDVELLAAIVASGGVFREIAVDWFSRPGGSLSPLRDGLPMLFSVWRAGRKFGAR